MRNEWEEIKNTAVKKTRLSKMESFQNKLAGLKFFDPACGSGNFLTETYLSLRKLENEILMEQLGDQIVMGVFNNPIKVSISQFYGIEINDFAVTVAKTALWIAESQMMKETEAIIHMDLDFLPLKTNANIIEGNALQLDWETVVPKNELNYIMGNPPFVGASMMTKEQKSEAVAVFGKGKRVNSIDYVGAWYHKAAAYIQNTDVKVAFVSTNSITQGEQVAALWDKLLNVYKIGIIFAWRTFKWNSESNDTAGVHVVIIGFSAYVDNNKKIIYSAKGSYLEAENINPYLCDAPNVLVAARGKPICDVPEMTKGNQPSDGGNLIFSEDEYKSLLAKDKNVAVCIRRYVGAKDYLNNNEVRYCLWLKDVSPSIYVKNTEIMRRLQAVREMRLNSTAAPTRKAADKPYLFFSTPQTDEACLCVSRVSSEKRKYIPIGFLKPGEIASDSLQIMMGATLYHFGILISNVHMAWMRAVSGRLEMRYRYSKEVVYNNFPWPNPTNEQKKAIEKTAQAILDARKLYSDNSLADLYDGTKMFLYPELLKAHQDNDIAVMAAYGIKYGMAEFKSENACVAMLMKMYQKLTNN